MDLKPSRTNTYQPAFSRNLGLWMHWLGNALVFPCHFGINQVMRSIDPFRFYRSKAMDQFAFPIELVSRPIRLAIGLAFFALGLVPALFGQAIKITASFLFKEKFQYYIDPKKENEIIMSHKPLDTLNVMTWNMAAMHSVPRRINGTRPVGSRMREAVEHILTMEQNPHGQKPDVICMQEVFTEKATRILVEGLQKTYPFVIHQVGQNTVGVNSGLLMFSKYPFQHIEFEPFHARYGQNAFSQKGVLGAIIHLPGHERAVVTNMHLEANGKFTRDKFFKKHPETKQAQFQQAFEMRDRLETIAYTENPCKPIISVMTGDTNSPLYFEDDTEIDEMLASKNPVIDVIREQYETPENEDANKSTCLEKNILSHDENDQNVNNAPNIKEDKRRIDYVEYRTSNQKKDITYLPLTHMYAHALHTGDMSDHRAVLGNYQLNRTPKTSY